MDSLKDICIAVSRYAARGNIKREMKSEQQLIEQLHKFAEAVVSNQVKLDADTTTILFENLEKLYDIEKMSSSWMPAAQMLPMIGVVVTVTNETEEWVEKAYRTGETTWVNAENNLDILGVTKWRI